MTFPIFNFPRIGSAPGAYSPFGLPGQSENDTAGAGESGVTPYPSEYVQAHADVLKADEEHSKAVADMKAKIQGAKDKREKARQKYIESLQKLGQIAPASYEEPKGMPLSQAGIALGIAGLGRLFGGESAVPGIHSALSAWAQGQKASKEAAAKAAYMNQQARNASIRDQYTANAQAAQIPYAEAQSDLTTAEKGLESELTRTSKEDISTAVVAQRREAANNRISTLMQTSPTAAIAQATLEFKSGAFGDPKSKEAMDMYGAITSAIKTGNPNLYNDSVSKTAERNLLAPSKKALNEARTYHYQALDAGAVQRITESEERVKKIQAETFRIKNPLSKNGKAESTALTGQIRMAVSDLSKTYEHEIDALVDEMTKKNPMDFVGNAVRAKDLEILREKKRANDAKLEEIVNGLTSGKAPAP